MNSKGYTIAVVILITIQFCLSDTLTLPHAQALLFNNNRDIQIAELRYLESLVEVSESKSSWYPRAETYANYSYQSKANRLVSDMDLSPMVPAIYKSLGLPPPAQSVQVINHLDQPMGDFDRFEWGVDLTYPLFTGFSRHNEVIARETSGTVKCLSLTSMKDRLSLELGALYFQWELSVKQIEVRQSYINQVSEYLVRIQNLYNGGVEPRSKVLEASARLESAKVALISAQNIFDSLRLEIVDFVRTGDRTAVPASYQFDLPDFLTGSRPRPDRNEIAIIDSTIKSLRYLERALVGNRFPMVYALAGYRAGNPGIIMGGDELIGWGVAGLQLKWTLYDGQKNWAQREQIRHEVDILKKERDKQTARWEKLTDMYRLQLEKIHRMKTAAELSLKAAEAFSADLKNTLDAGLSSPSDYLNALSAVAEASYMVAQAETARKIVSVQLSFALGETVEFK